MTHDFQGKIDSSFSKISEAEQSIITRFRHIVRLFPKHVAIHSGRQQVTYKELDERTNAIAKHLLNIDGDRQLPVAIHLDQGINFICSMLGVLKAARFYVPIDPAFPIDRNRYILSDSQTEIIITDTKNFSATKKLATTSQQIINLNQLSTTQKVDDLDIQIRPETLAYILYTSGSTGKPKGVFQNQRNVLFNARNQIQAMEITPDDRLALFYSSSVMGGVRVLYNALLQGACLHHFDLRHDGVRQIMDDIIQHKVTVYHSVPSLFRALVDTLPAQENFPDLRLLILGGDVVSRRDVELYKKLFSKQCKLFTALGSTETGTVRYFIFNKETSIGKKVPLGYPIEDVEIKLQNPENQKEVESGEVGEIVVNSPYLALGYWNRPELTEKVFLFDGQSGNRVYRTGDLGKFEENDCLYHQGRLDFQVKINGHRIELREIEYYILGFAGVKEVVVTSKINKQKNQYIVAYILPETEGFNLRLLKEHLFNKLPKHMHPSFFVMLDEFPLTPNEKINRLALPEPKDVGDGKSHKNFVAARTTLEKKLVTVWADVLGLKTIGINDDFFELGGSSAIAIQLVNNIEQALNRQLPLSALFQFTTIKDLATILDDPLNQEETSSKNSEDKLFQELMAFMAGRKGKRPRQDSLMLDLNEQEGKTPLFLCANSLKESKQISKYISDYSCYFLESGYPILIGLKQQFKRRRTYKNISTIASHHVRDILDIHPNGPYLLVGYSLGGRIAYEIAKQLQTRGKKIAFLCVIDVEGSGQKYSYCTQGIKSLLRSLKSGSYASIFHILKKIILNLFTEQNISQAKVSENEAYKMKGYSGLVTLVKAIPKSLSLKKRLISLIFPLYGWEEHSVQVLKMYGNHFNIIYDDDLAALLAHKIKNVIPDIQCHD